MVALPVALAMWRAGQGGRIRGMLIPVLTVVAAVLPAWVHVCGWDAAFGKLGWLTGRLTPGFRPLVPPFAASALIHGAIAAPQIALLLHWFQSSSGWALEEQASFDRPGARVFWTVTVPRMSPALLAGTAWTLLSTGREIAVTDIYQLGTLAELIYLGYSTGANDTLSGLWPGGTISLGLPLYAVVLGWLLVIAVVAIRPLSGRAALASRSRGGGWIGGQRFPWLAMTVTAGFFAVPLLNLVWRAGLRTVAVSGAVRQQWSPAQMFDAIRLSLAESLPEWQWSLLIATTGTAVFGSLAAIAAALSAGSRNGQMVYWGMVALLGAIPGPLTGRLLAECSNAATSEPMIWMWDRTIMGPVLASGLFLWPLAATALAALIHSTPRSLFEQAAMDGRGIAGRLWHVAIGSNRAGIAGIWMVLFALFLGELSASHLVRPSGIDILPRLALGKMHSGVDETMAGIALCIGLAVALAGGTGWLLLARWQGSRVGPG